MKLLALTRYGRCGASSRLRFLQFIPALEAQGHSVRVSPLFDDRYVEALGEAPIHRLGPALSGYLRRLWILLWRPDWDLVWLEKEALPWCPAWLERWLLRRRPYVLDFDDAIFHRYDHHPNRWVRDWFGHRLDGILAGAALVTVCNPYLESQVRFRGAHTTAVLPTVLDPDRYASTWRPPGNPFVVGWIGSPSTTAYLRGLAPALSRLSRRFPLVLRIVGAVSAKRSASLDLPGVPIETLPWSEETEAAVVASFDVGIMPLPEGPWERGKCGYKLLQYMASGKPVVASPVGVNATLVTPEVGFLAVTEADWEQALTVLQMDSALAAQLGQAGRARVMKNYALQGQTLRLHRLLLMTTLF
ncbi:Glycosyltransferase [Gammaproteobacteria bacterium]